MIRAGLSIERLKRLNPGYGPESLHCHISDQDVIDRAKLEGHTRALCSAEKARPMLDGAIVLIGNAPLALARIARYALEEGVRPALGRRDARRICQRGGVKGTSCPVRCPPDRP